MKNQPNNERFADFNIPVVLHKSFPPSLVWALEKVGVLIRGRVLVEAALKEKQEKMKNQLLDEVLSTINENGKGTA